MQDTISLIIFAGVAFQAIRTKNPIYFCMVALWLIVFFLKYFAKKNPEADWVKVLYGFYGVRTDTKYMLKDELYVSGFQFLKYSLLFLALVILIARFQLESNLFMMGIFFGSVMLFMILFGGGLYLLLRGLLRKRNYIPPE